MRTKTAGFVVIFAFLLLILSFFKLILIEGKKYKELSAKNSIRLLSQPGGRGRILDRTGNVIVDNTMSYDVMVLPQDKSRLDKTLGAIAQILNVDSRELRLKFKSGFLSQNMPVAVSRNIDIKKAILLEELKFDFPGILIQPHPLRHYPYGRLASHVIGYLGEIDRWRLTKLEDYGYKTKDIMGYGGVEEKYDYYLRQEDGGLSVEVDSRGNLKRVLGLRPAQSGKDIQLTLDLRIQKIVENALAGWKGAIVLMDPRSGEIIAMASLPNFNPSVFVLRYNSLVRGLFNNPGGPLLNRAIGGSYPAGSLFKVIVASAALETGKIGVNTTFYCPGNMRLGNAVFACWGMHDSQNLIGAMAYSCNVFFYRTGLLTGPQGLHEYAARFGLSKPASVDLPYEVGGLVPHPLWKKIHRFRNWFDGDTLNLSIGQGDVLVTPLQMARVMAVFANRGKLVTPYIVKSIDNKDISGYHARIADLALKRSTIEYIRQGLRAVVNDEAGTGNVLSQLTVPVAGKTGTAQAAKGQPHAWFAGFFPYKDPKFAICVLLEHGGPGKEACIVAKEIIENMVREGLL